MGEVVWTSTISFWPASSEPPWSRQPSWHRHKRAARSRSGALPLWKAPFRSTTTSRTAGRPAVVNTPLTTGDSIWTEPNARSEVSRRRHARPHGRLHRSSTCWQIDDNQIRLQVAQGRVDVKTIRAGPRQPYQIVTPRGTINLQPAGRLLRRGGLARRTRRVSASAPARRRSRASTARPLAVDPGEVGEVFGDAARCSCSTLKTAPPAQPASWAARDRQVVYDQQPQYVSAGMTGYEDLNGYGNWVQR